MSGSVDIRGAVDCHLAMGSYKDRKENQFYIVITQTKCREDELLPAFKVLIKTEKDDNNKTTKMTLQYEGEFKMDNAEETLNKAKEAIIEFLAKSADEKVWRDVIVNNKPGGFGSRKLDDALKALEQVDKKIGSVTGKELGMKGSESRRKFYYIKEVVGNATGIAQSNICF